MRNSSSKPGNRSCPDRRPGASSGELLRPQALFCFSRNGPTNINATHRVTFVGRCVWRDLRSTGETPCSIRRGSSRAEGSVGNGAQIPWPTCSPPRFVEVYTGPIIMSEIRQSNGIHGFYSFFRRGIAPWQVPCTSSEGRGGRISCQHRQEFARGSSHRGRSALFKRPSASQPCWQQRFGIHERIVTEPRIGS
jgi:hypothetical protein